MQVNKDFLKETHYCNYKHQSIQKIVKQFEERYSNKKKLAVALFYYVRDSFLYRVGHWNKKASETLSERKGVCTAKSNLLIALLRAAGIPAGYGVMKVKGRDYFGPIVLDFLRNKISEKSIHIYTCVYLNGQWIKCDPSDDKEFSKNTSHFNPQSTLVDWNGEDDAEIKLNPDHILEDNSPLANIDHIIGKKSRISKKMAIKIGNLYIDFLRKNGREITNTKDLEPLFKSWLKKTHFFLFLLFIIQDKLFS